MKQNPETSIKRTYGSAGFRLNLWHAALFTVSSVALFGLVYAMLALALGRKDEEAVSRQRDEYAAIYRETGPRGLEQWVRQREASRELQSFFVLINSPKGQRVLLLASKEWVEFDVVEFGPFILESNRGTLRVPEGEQRDLVFAPPLRLPDGNVIIVGRKSDSRETLLEPVRRIFGLALAPIVLVGFLVGWFLSWRTMRPIREIVDTVNAIVETRDLDARVTTRETKDELDQLAVLFNRMLEQNQRLFEAMHHSLDNVAHDLRTPLTRLRGVAELALREETEPAAFKEALADCVEESDRVLAMLKALMDVAEAESGALKLDLQPTDLKAMLEELAEAYEFIGEARGVVVERDFPDEAVEASVDAVRMRQAIGNLLDNAVKYSVEKAPVWLRLSREDDAIVIQVENEGPTISAEDRARIFDRLYRADKSRSERGLGLGLSLVRAVIEAHGGEAAVSSQPPDDGAVFAVRLPTRGSR